MAGFAALIAMGAQSGAGAAKAPPVVLFVCRFGTVKSAIAREFFRRRAMQRGIAVSAFSRGLTPAEHMSPALARALSAEGINTRADPVTPLAPADIARADLVVYFDPLPATLSVAHARDWTDLASFNEAYPQARQDLMRRIDGLLDELSRPAGR